MKPYLAFWQTWTVMVVDHVWDGKVMQAVVVRKNGRIMSVPITDLLLAKFTTDMPQDWMDESWRREMASR